jgi:lipopolysaccharide transport system ATP-binding protein
VTLTIDKGARVGLTGPNGAGKSTLLSVMAGILTPSRGSSITRGRVLALLGGPQQGLDPEQTGRENALFLGVQFGESPASMQARLSDIKDFSGLGIRFEHPVHTYSSGMQVRLRFSAITSLSADILLVDEGIGQADEEFNERAGARLADFYRGAGTVVLASHNNDLLERHCTAEVAVHAGACLPKGCIKPKNEANDTALTPST